MIKDRFQQYETYISPLNEEPRKVKVNFVGLPAEFYENNLEKPLLDKVSKIPVWQDYSVDEQRGLIDTFVENKLCSEKISCSHVEKGEIVEELLNTFRTFEKFIDDSDMTDFLKSYLNSGKKIQIEIDGGKSALIVKTESGYSVKSL